MTLVMGSLQLGLIYGMLAVGVYIAFRILGIPDLSAEGTFTFGLAVSAALTVAGHPLLGVLLGFLAGCLGGAVTGVLQTKLQIHPILAGILTMSGLYSVNLAVMGSSSNLSLVGLDTLFHMSFDLFSSMDKEIVKLLLPALFCLVLVVLLALFFKTHEGLCIRATGDNEEMVRASSINVDVIKILALSISNGWHRAVRRGAGPVPGLCGYQLRHRHCSGGVGLGYHRRGALWPQGRDLGAVRHCGRFRNLSADDRPGV